ncbi:MAG: DivIVA domain-containing protein [Lachnospiraceae bacterium]|nr:DivIVA domain-containing protein [Lachnospiraceae bacterium]
MLTPVEIQSKTFKSGGLGYDKKDVDAFMREAYRSFETLYRENMELKDKVSVLNEGIQYYKSIEKTLQKALVLAEKTAEETRNAANQDAKRIEKEAAAKANIMLADAKNELDSLHNQTVALIQQYEKYKAQFKSLAAAQIDILNSDAYSINVAHLDAFVSDNSLVKGANDLIKGQKSNKKNAERKADDAEVTELTSDTKKNNTIIENPSKKSADDDFDDFDFSDIEIAGQEEFDFMNSEDDE